LNGIRIWKHDNNPADYGWKVAEVDGGYVSEWHRWPYNLPEYTNPF
jgi:hypothetical protein